MTEQTEVKEQTHKVVEYELEHKLKVNETELEEEEFDDNEFGEDEFDEGEDLLDEAFDDDEEDFDGEFDDEFDDDFDEEDSRVGLEEDEEDFNEEDSDFGEDIEKDDVISEPEKIVLDDDLEDESTKIEEVKAYSQDSNDDLFDFSKGSYTILPTIEVDINKIAYSTPMKDGRKETITGLTKSIRESGVLTPIDIILLPAPDEEMREMMEEEGEVVPEYLLVSGLRRIFASLKNGIKTIPANIWDFKDKEQGQKACLELGLWLNRQQKHSWGEVWSLYQVLEEKSQIRPAMAEFLFQLEGGDAMKLKDVMLCEYPEIREELLAGTKTLEQSYKQLMKERKEEDELEMSDSKGLSDASDDTASIVDDNGEVDPLDNSQVMELMEMLDKKDEHGVSDDDFNELNSEEDVMIQDVKNRTFVDPLVKKSTLYRDNFKCICCGTGGVAFLDVIVFHHIIPVHAGGADTVENGATLCDTCHLTLHVAERNGGRLPMSKEQFDEYSDEQQNRIKNILRLAKVAYKADKLKGYSREEINKLARAAASHRMPGENIKENLSLYKEAHKNPKDVTPDTKAISSNTNNQPVDEDEDDLDLD